MRISSFLILVAFDLGGAAADGNVIVGTSEVAEPHPELTH